MLSEVYRLVRSITSASTVTPVLIAEHRNCEGQCPGPSDRDGLQAHPSKTAVITVMPRRACRLAEILHFYTWNNSECAGECRPRLSGEVF
jgi:hypothetical protein